MNTHALGAAATAAALPAPALASAPNAAGGDGRVQSSKKRPTSIAPAPVAATNGSISRMTAAKRSGELSGQGSSCEVKFAMRRALAAAAAPPPLPPPRRALPPLPPPLALEASAAAAQSSASASAISCASCATIYSRAVLTIILNAVAHCRGGPAAPRVLAEASFSSSAEIMAASSVAPSLASRM